jgi:GNAT superfamily N-acetyltransferase
MWEMCREWVRCTPGGELHETSALTLSASPHAAFFNNLALVRDAIDADAVIGAVRRFYVERERPFALMLRAHADGALERDLVGRGFTVLVSEPGMIFTDDPGTRPMPAGLEIRAATTDRGRRDFLHVSAESYATYEQPRDYTAVAFAALESVCSPTVQGFVGYAGGAPVVAAALYLTHGIAGIGWVGTVPEARGCGYAEAVTWAVVREGFRRGGAFANLQASPMGKAVYERMGFTTPTAYHLLVGAS